MVFDAVYLLRRQEKERMNITYALLDFYVEEFDMAEFCERNVIILSPDKLSSHG